MKHLSILLLFSVLTILTACSKPVTKNDVQPKVVQNVGPQQFESMMNGENIVILDVRTPEETSEGKIAGAIEIDYRADNFQEEIAKLDKSKSYLVYCRSGGRSAKSCDVMKDQGFDKLTNLKGGYNGWKDYIADR